jgi:O-antigen ligase
MPVTAPWTVRTVQLAIAGAAALVGLMAALEPKFAIAAAIAVAFMLLVVADVTVGLCLFVAVTFLDVIPAFEGLSIAKAAGALLVLSWIATVATRRGHKGLIATHPGLALALVLLACWPALSALWATDTFAAVGGAQRWALNLALVPIVFAAVREPRHVRWLFAIFVIGGLATALATIAGVGGVSVESEEGRLGSGAINPNALGGALVIASVFAGALGAARERTISTRALWLLAGAVAAIGLAATLSRGALLGMAVAFLVAPLVAGPGRRVPALLLGGIACAAIALSIVAFVPETAAQRLTSSDHTGSGRTDIWRVGLRMAEDHPVVGVGSDNFAETSIRYLVRPGVIQMDEFIVDTPKVAHNVYLQVFAELGIVGLLLYLTVIGLCLRAALQAARNFHRRGDRSADLLARALVVALVGLLAATFFSSQLYSKQLYLLLALGPALLHISRMNPASRRSSDSVV